VRRCRVEGVHPDGDTELPELVDDVLASPRGAGRPRVPRADGDEPLEVAECGGAVEHRPRSGCGPRSGRRHPGVVDRPANAV